MTILFGGDFFGRELKTYQQNKVLGTQDERGFEQAVVKRVIDGDTVELSDGRKVRYIGMDTPETKHPNKGVECFGVEASNFNKDLVEGKIVQLEKDVSETDRYGRLLRYVWIEDRQVNKVLVSEGYAFARSYPPDISYQDEFREAEKFARENNKGLWAECYAEEREKLNQYIQEVDQKIQGASDQTQVVGEGCVIKGNISDNGQLYHLPECPSYSKTVISESNGERWFCSVEEAEQAGWTKAGNCP